jgi:hypothetical protein
MSDGGMELQAARDHARAGRWLEAGPAFVRAGLALPEPLDAMAGAVLSASRAAQAGRLPPAMAPLAVPTRPLSVVACSIDARKAEAFRASLARSAGAPYELILIEDARSLSEAYARGVARACGEHVVLCHDDVEFLVDDLAARVAMHLARFALVGVVGTRALSGAAWIWGGPPANDGWLVHPGARGGVAACVYGAHGSPVAGAQALDGVFMAGRRDALLGLGFDADTFDGFHFYDLDLSYRAHRAGLPVGICGDILLLHRSSGTFGADYARYARRFFAKFPALPLGPKHADPNFVVHEVPDRATARALFGWLESWHREALDP